MSKKQFLCLLLGGVVFLGLCLTPEVFAQGPPSLGPEVKTALNQYLGIYAGDLGTAAKGTLSAANIIAWILFGGIGFVAFSYGKKLGSWKPLVIGIALMSYPLLISNTAANYAVGILLTTALYVFRE